MLRPVLAVSVGSALAFRAAVNAVTAVVGVIAVAAVVVVIAVSGVVGVVSLASPSAALAQGTNPLQPGFPQPSVSVPTTTTATPTATASSTSSGAGSGFTGSSALIIAIGAIVVLGGISLFIWRDARRRAPVRHHAEGDSATGRRSGSKPRAKPRKPSPAERRRRKRGRAR